MFNYLVTILTAVVALAIFIWLWPWSLIFVVGEAVVVAIVAWEFSS